MGHVFISYHKQSSRDYARELADFLIANGFYVWIDDHIDYGETWEKAIFRAIDSADALIVIMTAESWESRWVTNERQYAEDLGLRIFPLRIEEFIFPTYRATQFPDLRGGQLPSESFLDTLAHVAERSLRGGGVEVRASEKDSAPTNSTPVKGKDIQQLVPIDLSEAYHGTTRNIPKGNRTLHVTIPPGATNGTRVRFAGQGEPGRNGGSPGDYYFIVEVEKHAQFTRDRDNLYIDVKLDMFTAIFGGKVNVPTLTKPFDLKIPPATQSGATIRVAGKGMPLLRKPDTFGDLYVRVLITVPRTLTPQQRTALENLQQLFSSGR